MEEIKTFLTEQAFLLEDFLRKLPLLRSLDKKKEIQPALLLQIFVATLTMIVFVLSPQSIFLIYILVLPCRQSLKVLSARKNSKTKAMLSYWVVYGLVLFAEESLSVFLLFVPYWQWVRVGLLIWTLQYERATAVYSKWLVHLLKAN